MCANLLISTGNASVKVGLVSLSMHYVLFKLTSVFNSFNVLIAINLFNVVDFKL